MTFLRYYHVTERFLNGLANYIFRCRLFVKGTSDGAKAVKGYYYLGTVICDDKLGGNSLYTAGDDLIP